ncbi:MAG: HAD-IA family hydrolase [Spirochaetaceae bacterium]|jgi:1-acyl-sn-glycerol-3-phosphate acyltransferase/FMN phosphatase YigB (HAD superfamily)|nr:HAD-IA family hydrolase [Spirochaetaceae bacterium]
MIDLYINGGKLSFSAVIFDLDGTLFNSCNLALRVVFNRILDLPVIYAERKTRVILKGCDFGDEAKYYDAFFSILSKNAAGKNKEKLREWYFDKYMPRIYAVLKKWHRPKEGVNELFALLNSQNTPFAVFSDYPEVDERLNVLGIKKEPLCQTFSQGAFGAQKPAPRAFLEIARSLGVKAEETLVVGDRDDTDGEGARGAGMTFLKVDKKDCLSIKKMYVPNISQIYIPQTGIDYPDDPFEYINTPEKIINVNLDENYKYLDESFSFKLKSALLYAAIFTVVFPLSVLRFGLRIEGREKLKKYRSVLKNGAMTCANHVHRWDFLFILKAVRWRRLYFPARAANIEGKDRTLIRLAGGIPIPEKISAIRVFNAAFDVLAAKKKWLHAFPESARWDYFTPIRPFKKGVWTMAVKYNFPVIPMAFSYRKPNLIARLFKTPALITLRIGEPVFPDAKLTPKKAAESMRKSVHQRMVELSGVSNNPYTASGE